MIFRKIWQAFAAVIIIFFSTSGSNLAETVRTDLSEIEMRADHVEIAPGNNFYIVIELTPNVGWHAYWENPGDAGLKLTMDWKLPDGVTVGGLQFPSPHLIPFEEIVSYGYDGKVTIIAEASIDENVDVSAVDIGGDAFWLVCSDALCVPQETEISFSLPVGEQKIDQRVSAIVEAAKDDMPTSVDWKSSFYTDGENFHVKTELPEQYVVIESAYLFPHTEGMMENVYQQDLSFVDGDITGRFKNAYGYVDNDHFNFVLSFRTGEGDELSFSIRAEKSSVPILETVKQDNVSNGPMASELGLLAALGFAFLGGIILNLMPCVFPILSLKAMSVAALSSKDVKEAKISGLLYTAGVMICFSLIGALVNVFSVGWGFQMQIPLVNFLLGLLMVTIGLNLLGVFEFGGSFIGVGQRVTESDGTKTGNRRATFFTGFLAVVVATPCTAPFMASALGFAFINGGLIGMLIFLALGFGLAFPYLLICYVPQLRDVLPLPGAWMETMKNILGFPMLATALWLFWIMGNQLGVNAMTVSVIASLLLAIALWSISRQGIFFRVLIFISFIGIAYAGYYLNNAPIENSSELAEDGGLNAVPFTSTELGRLLDQGEPVFVYFTADWCVTCKLNERVALSQESVHKAFEQKNITVMAGDWTNQNPDITQTLQSYGRIGVPLYLYFPSGRKIEYPDILPQILTPDTVINAL